MVDTCTSFPSVNMFVMMWCLLTWICFLAVDDSLAGHSEISEKDTIIWGPGLKADAVLPARYFFIQAVDKHGNNLTESLGEDAFEVNFQQSDGERVRAAPRILDRHDGSYIVRYRLHWSSKDMTINVKYRGIHVAHSPYLLKGPVFQEKCYCPQEDEQWQETLQCRPSHRQIKLDLQLFRKVDMFKVREEAVRRFNEKGRHSLCHIVVKDNKVYRKTYGEHVGFKMFMDAILLSMARKVRIPDIEFFVNLGDWPLEHRKSNENPLPIFSWCGSEDTRDIIMPTYDVTESTLETMGRVTLDLLSVQANTGPTWENKSSSAIWRGRDSRQERLDLVKMSRKHPDIIDAKLTNMFFFKKNEEELGEIVKHISFFDFFKHKYQINIDGTVAAYRFPYLMAGDSLVFKQDSSYYEHFYKSLKPYVHYVPFKRDLSDLMEKLQWARDHDEEARKIAKTGQLFIRENMMAADIFCYHQTLFKEYAKRLTSPVEVLEGMELVEQPTGSETHCDCQTLEKRERKKKEEL